MVTRLRLGLGEGEPLMLSLCRLGVEAIILRYSGFNAYRRAIPFFLGLALGDYILGSLWSILDIPTTISLYLFFS